MHALPLADMRRYAMKLTRGNAADADDVVQDAAERLIRNGMQGARDGKRYAMSTVHNAHFDRYRTIAARSDHVDIDCEELTVPCAQEYHVMLREAIEALNKLPRKLREALCLTVLEGMSAPEAAAVLGVPPQTVLTRAHRGREALRALFQ